MRASILNQSMQKISSSSRGGLPHPFKTQVYTWDSRVSLIRRELVALTGDTDIAVVLNQLLYWSQRLKDYDLLLEEEKSIPHREIPEGKGHVEQELNSRSQYGWFYKSTPELIEETLLCVSRVTMRRYLNVLLERGWVQERGNSQHKWDRTTHYRVNLYQLDKDLKALGYGLPGFILEDDGMERDENRQKSSMSKIEPSMVQKSTFECKENDSSLSSTEENRQKSSVSKNEPSRVQNLTLECKESEHSNVKKWSFITENKTENTNREHTARAHEDKNFYEKDFSEEVLRIWNGCTGQGESGPAGASGLPPAHLTDERRRRIHVLFLLYFENDLAQWEQFCKRVTNSPFLMGQGARRWRVSLDWILVEENLLKVLEGNFDDGKILDQKAEHFSEDAKQKEISAVLASIEDPIWKKLCSQLDFSPESHEFVSLGELKSIVNARFLEIEDDRLVWVGSNDPHVLSRIEDLRLKLSSSVKRMFPQSRSIRTRLDKENPSLNHHNLSTKPTEQTGENHD